MKSALHKLADIELGRPLAEVVAEHRSEGKSWRQISMSVLRETGDEIDIAPETLRNWFPELVEAAS